MKLSDEKLEKLYQEQTAKLESIDFSMSEEELEKEIQNIQNWLSKEEFEQLGNYTIWRTTSGTYLDDGDEDNDNNTPFNEFEKWRLGD